MQLIYTTHDAAHAERLAAALEEAAIPHHVSGTEAARMPGFPGGRVADSVGVWLRRCAGSA